MHAAVAPAHLATRVHAAVVPFSGIGPRYPGGFVVWVGRISLNPTSTGSSIVLTLAVCGTGPEQRKEPEVGREGIPAPAHLAPMFASLECLSAALFPSTPAGC